MKLSLCLATYNEEVNLPACLESAKNIADEIVIVDGASTDQTVKIAKSYGARVIITDNPPMFHINKQKAIDEARGDWILQLDADERLTPELADEIKKIINMNQKELEDYQKNLPERKLFLKHQRLIEESSVPPFSLRGRPPTSKAAARFPSRSKRRSSPSVNEPIVAFYLPRLNYFLGKFLRYGGVYPDGSIRLVKKGKARFPCRSVHELMEVDGRVGWLQNPILHYDSPTFKRYWERNNRYINMMVGEFQQQKLPKTFMNFMNFILYKPISWFLITQILNKGILDGWQGVVFSFFSALRFPRAYIRYISKQ